MREARPQFAVCAPLVQPLPAGPGALGDWVAYAPGFGRGTPIPLSPG